MGMYDTVIVSSAASLYLPEPFKLDKDVAFQTKSIENLLWTFELVPNGSRLELHYYSNWTKETEIYRWTGLVEMYSDLGGLSLESLFLKIVDGIVVLIDTVSPTGQFHSVKCSLVQKDGELDNVFSKEREEVADYIEETYGIRINGFESPSERLYSLEGRRCLNPAFAWMFKKSY